MRARSMDAILIIVALAWIVLLIIALAWIVPWLIVKLVRSGDSSRRNRPVRSRGHSGRHERRDPYSPVPYHGSATGSGDDGRDQRSDDWGGGTDQGGDWGGGDSGGGGGDGGGGGSD
jgi:uncharacterized membrane protein YgcG